MEVNKVNLRSEMNLGTIIICICIQNTYKKAPQKYEEILITKNYIENVFINILKIYFLVMMCIY